jgi:hypothetical protein
MQNCLLWSGQVFRSITAAFLTCLLSFPLSACGQVDRETSVRDWINLCIESEAHPQQSLRVHPLTYAAVWAAFPSALTHREKNTVRVQRDSSGTATYLLFDNSEPSFDLDRVNYAPSAASEVSSVLLRIVRERRGYVFARDDLIRRFDPTVELAASRCVPEASSVAAYSDTAAFGWRCTTRDEELQVDVYPSCATRPLKDTCLIVQLSASWKDADRR